MSSRPVLAISLAYVGGVALGGWLPQEPAAWGWATAAAAALWAALLAGGCLAAGKRVGLAVFVAAGVFRLQGDLAPLFEQRDHIAEGDVVARGRLARPPELREGDVVLHLEEAQLRRQNGTVRPDLPLQVVFPAGTESCAVGDVVTVRGRLREIRGDRNLGWFPEPVTNRGRRCAARVVADSAAWVRREGRAAARGPGAAVLRWRAAADAFWKSRPGAAGQILNSLTTGERAGIPAATQEEFRRSGLTHLLAISGMNVGFLAAMVLLSLIRVLALVEPLALRTPVQPVAAALTLPALWFFLLFSGSQIPVGRAVLSGGIGLVGAVLWRRVRPADAWALAALAIVAWDPRSLFTASFQLSFAAVAALMLVASRFESSAPEPSQPADSPLVRMYRAARALFVVSLAASAATAPLVAFHFQQVSLVGPLANIVAVPLTGFVVLPAAWISLGAAAIWPPAGDWCASLALRSADLIVGCAAWFALPAWACVNTVRPPLLPTLAFLALACLLLPRPTPGLLAWRVAACAAAAAASGVWAIAIHRQQLLVVVLDVGQGLSAAVRLPGGGSLLFDAGPRWRGYDAGECIVVPALRRLGVARLDTLAISHRHPDHEGGVAAVRAAFDVGETWRSDGDVALARGERRALGGDSFALVLNPMATSGRPPPESEANDRSLAVLLPFGDTGFVLTGDAGALPAAEFAAAAPCPPAHIALQAPHHGGSPEACRVLAASLRPEVSVIPVGRNTYGHPKEEAVAALEVTGRVLRSDRDGAVFLVSDGRRWEVRTWLEMSRKRAWAERWRWLVAGW